MQHSENTTDTNPSNLGGSQNLPVIHQLSSPLSVDSNSISVNNSVPVKQPFRPPAMTDELLSGSSIGGQPHIISPTRAARYPYWNSGQMLPTLPTVYGSPSLLPLNRSPSLVALNKGDSGHKLGVSQSLSLQCASLMGANAYFDPGTMAPPQIALIPPEQTGRRDLGDSILYCDSPSLQLRREEGSRLSSSLEYRIRPTPLHLEGEAPSYRSTSAPFNPLAHPQTLPKVILENEEVPELDHTARPPPRQDQEVRVLGFPFAGNKEHGSVDENSFLTMSNTNTVNIYNEIAPITPMEPHLSIKTTPLQPLNEFDSVLESGRLFFSDIQNLNGKLQADDYHTLTAAFTTIFNISRIQDAIFAFCVKSKAEKVGYTEKLTSLITELQQHSTAFYEKHSQSVELGKFFQERLNKKLRLLIITKEVTEGILMDLGELLGTASARLVPASVYSGGPLTQNGTSSGKEENIKSRTRGWGEDFSDSGNSGNSKGSGLTPFTNHEEEGSPTHHVDPVGITGGVDLGSGTLKTSGELGFRSVSDNLVIDSVLNSMESKVAVDLKRLTGSEVLKYLSRREEMKCHLDGDMLFTVQEMCEKEMEIRLLELVVSGEHKPSQSNTANQESTSGVVDGEKRSSLTTDFPERLANCLGWLEAVEKVPLYSISQIKQLETAHTIEEKLRHFHLSHDWMEICEWYSSLALFCFDKNDAEAKEEYVQYLLSIIDSAPDFRELFDQLLSVNNAESIAKEQLEISKAELGQMVEQMVKLEAQTHLEIIRCLVLNSLEPEVTVMDDSTGNSLTSDQGSAEKIHQRLLHHYRSLEGSIYAANSFYRSIQSCVSQLEHTTEAYSKFRQNPLPPSSQLCSEETFNLRSLARYIYGLVNVSPTQTSTEMIPAEEKMLCEHLLTTLGQISALNVRLSETVYSILDEAVTHFKNEEASDVKEESTKKNANTTKRTVQDILKKKEQPSSQSLARLSTGFFDLNKSLERSRISLLRSFAVLTE